MAGSYGLTKPLVSQISAKGGADQTEITVEAERLKIAAPSESSVSEVASGHFDSVLGIFTVTLYNGEQIKVDGFPTASKIPPGPTGPQGLPGKDGKPGKSGKPGAAGAPGCIGAPGEKGPIGPVGLDGRQGPQGAPGPRGLTGPQGPVGPKGPAGVIGPPGPTGPRGDQGPAGAPGAAGTPGAVNIVVSTTDPGAAAGAGALWVNPSILPPASTGVITPPTGTITDPDVDDIHWP